MQQTAWEIDHPVSDHDFGDRGDLRSCDSIDSPIPARIPRPSQRTRPFARPMPIDSMNLNHLRDQHLSVPPAIRPDMRDAVRPSPLDPLYPGIGDHPRSTLRLSRTHCLQAPSDEITASLIQYQQLRNPGDYHCYIEGVNVDDFGRDTPLPIDHTRHGDMPVPVNEAVLALNRHNQRIAKTMMQHDDDVPDLLLLHSSSPMSTQHMEQLSHDTDVTQLSAISGYKQYR
jgi:hypothetical protein